VSYNFAPFPYPGVDHLRIKLSNPSERKIAANGVEFRKQSLSSWEDITLINGSISV